MSSDQRRDQKEWSLTMRKTRRKYLAAHRTSFHSNFDEMGEHVDGSDASTYSPMELAVDVNYHDGSAQADFTCDSTLTTKDLMRMSYQIARVMEFLAANRVIHRDLAARNILAALPAKWMAPEALKMMTFNEKTDVWSFGITMWEIFSLGASPYSTTDIPKTGATDLALMISSGYQMERPVAAPSFVYALMQMCRSLNPADRPTFREAQTKLQAFVIEDYYLKLDGVYDNYNMEVPGGQANESVLTLNATYARFETENTVATVSSPDSFNDRK
ncbi:putative Fibroblast growth factor receptor 3 [Hypsibius exemplaris]|uniref:Fibroblast growth factor receptor 3 n=1 Tax=Hypsibius exemplaris TaxID=2072580 RepID=A0A1W0WRD6_HYPEX|nr:putative Fibroblast growth factor receptor 3 [Hypsibius exemplaris]